MDKLSAQRRSDNMRQIRSKDTLPERLLRRWLHAEGYRFRLYRRDLPGTPDLTFPGRHKVIFVHGCFWHQHRGCKEGRVPGSRTAYWGPKLIRNQNRDIDAQQSLRRQGWKILVIWECEFENPDSVMRRARKFLDAPK
jgi:DNA mismatch endonuclease, patch repair protein